MATKKEIIETAKKVLECYFQENEPTVIPYWHKPNGQKLTDEEIKKRWLALSKAIS